MPTRHRLLQEVHTYILATNLISLSTLGHSIHYTTYFLQPLAYNLLPTTCLLQPASYNSLPITYFLQPTSYFLLHTSYFLQAYMLTLPTLHPCNSAVQSRFAMLRIFSHLHYILRIFSCLHYILRILCAAIVLDWQMCQH